MNKNISQLQVMLLSVLILSILVLSACGSKINQANFNKIETGMTEQEVQALLGQPTESSSMNIGGFSGTSSTWINKDVTISIQFLNGKVGVKEFAKPNK